MDRLLSTFSVATKPRIRHYLHWAIHNPTHFQIISTRSLIGWVSLESLRADNRLVRSLMKQAINDAEEQGRLRSSNVAQTLALAQ